MNEQPNQDTSYNTFYNAAASKTYSDNIGVIQMRLDSSRIKSQISELLTGKKTILNQDELGNDIPSFIIVGEPLVNQEGYQSIMMYIEMIMNTQTVQGNFTEEEYADYLYRTRADLATSLMQNRKRYAIPVGKYGELISKIMRFTEPFFSRLKNDKERLSYSNTMRETVVNTPTRGLPKGAFG